MALVLSLVAVDEWQARPIAARAVDLDQRGALLIDHLVSVSQQHVSDSLRDGRLRLKSQHQGKKS
jgi:hypothetical protein